MRKERMSGTGMVEENSRVSDTCTAGHLSRLLSGLGVVCTAPGKAQGDQGEGACSSTPHRLGQDDWQWQVIGLVIKTVTDNSTSLTQWASSAGTQAPPTALSCAV